MNGSQKAHQICRRLWRLLLDDDVGVRRITSHETYCAIFDAMVASLSQLGLREPTSSALDVYTAGNTQINRLHALNPRKYQGYENIEKLWTFAMIALHLGIFGPTASLSFINKLNSSLVLSIASVIFLPPWWASSVIFEFAFPLLYLHPALRFPSVLVNGISLIPIVLTTPPFGVAIPWYHTLMMLFGALARLWAVHFGPAGSTFCMLWLH